MRTTNLNVRSRFIVFGFAIAALLGWIRPVDVEGQQISMWYRGVTHTHTNRSAGDLPPDALVAWYHDHGYQFVSITDKNSFLDPGSVRLPAGARSDFILIPGEEITFGVHYSALNVAAAVYAKPGDTAQSLCEAVQGSGGAFIVNHPYYGSAVTEEDFVAARDVRLFELCNAAVEVGHASSKTIAEIEAVWDRLLTRGKRIFAVASDDGAMHGKGWVMVRSKELTPAAICSALLAGDFYASNGVLLKRLEIVDRKIEIEVDLPATDAELQKGSVLGTEAPAGTKPGVRIDFIGPGGTILSSVEGDRVSYALPAKGVSGYVRARAMIVREVGGKSVQFCAWVQPVFPLVN